MEVKKVVFVGPQGCGKSTTVRYLRDGHFSPLYVKTLGVEVDPIRSGETCYNIWDCAGDPSVEGLGDGYYAQAHVGVVFCSLADPYSIQSVPYWIERFRASQPNAKVILCATKKDIAFGCVVDQLRAMGQEHGLPIIYTSCKEGVGCDVLLSAL